MNNFNMVGWVTFILVLVGGVDSGLYGLFQFHILEVILGAKFLGRVFYILVGLSAGYLIYYLYSVKMKNKSE